MKILIFILLLGLQVVRGEVVGASTRTQLLQQLRLSLDINLNEIELEASLVDKLPVENNQEVINPTFLAAWQQITFFACRHALETGAQPFLNNEVGVKEWLTTLARRTWGLTPLTSDINQIYKSVYKTSSKETTPLKNQALACSVVFLSPKTYIIVK